MRTWWAKYGEKGRSEAGHGGQYNERSEDMVGNIKQYRGERSEDMVVRESARTWWSERVQGLVVRESTRTWYVVIVIEAGLRKG